MASTGVLDRVAAITDTPVGELVDGHGFAGSEITQWCSTCSEWAVPMANGTCGFCGCALTEAPVQLVLGPPTELGELPAPPPVVPRRGKRKKFVVVKPDERPRRRPLKKGEPGYGPVCACGGPKGTQAHQCRKCWNADGCPGAGGKGTPRPAMRGPYGVSEELMLEARRMYNDEQISLREVARRIYDQTYGYSTVRSLGEALYRGFRNRGWTLRSQSDATRLRNWKHGLKQRVQTNEEQNAYRHWLAQQRGWQAVQGPGRPECKGSRATSPGKGQPCTRPAMNGSEFCYQHDPATAAARAEHMAKMRARVPRDELLERLEAMRAKASANAARRRAGDERMGAVA
jgi:hypothetical protein